jgi:hypothetical protein
MKIKPKEAGLIAAVVIGLWYLHTRQAQTGKPSRTNTGNTMSQTYHQGPWQNDTSKYR